MTAPALHTKSGSATMPRWPSTPAPGAVYGAFAAGAMTRTPGGRDPAVRRPITPGRVPGTTTSASTAVNSSPGGPAARP